MENIKMFVSTSPPRELDFKILILNLSGYLRIPGQLFVYSELFIFISSLIVGGLSLEDFLMSFLWFSLLISPFWFSITAYNIITGRNINYLLKYGTMSYGKLMKKECTGWLQEREGDIYKFTFKFNAIDKNHKVIYRTSKEKIIKKIEDGLQPILYDPTKPSNAKLLYALPQYSRFSTNKWYTKAFEMSLHILWIIFAWILPLSGTILSPIFFIEVFPALLSSRGS